MDSIKTEVKRFVYNLRECYYKNVLNKPRIKFEDSNNLSAYKNII